MTLCVLTPVEKTTINSDDKTTSIRIYDSTQLYLKMPHSILAITIKEWSLSTIKCGDASLTGEKTRRTGFIWFVVIQNLCCQLQNNFLLTYANTSYNLHCYRHSTSGGSVKVTINIKHTCRTEMILNDSHNSYFVVSNTK